MLRTLESVFLPASVSHSTFLMPPRPARSERVGSAGQSWAGGQAEHMGLWKATCCELSFHCAGSFGKIWCADVHLSMAMVGLFHGQGRSAGWGVCMPPGTCGCGCPAHSWAFLDLPCIAWSLEHRGGSLKGVVFMPVGRGRGVCVWGVPDWQYSGIEIRVTPSLKLCPFQMGQMERVTWKHIYYHV